MALPEVVKWAIQLDKMLAGMLELLKGHELVVPADVVMVMLTAVPWGFSMVVCSVDWLDA